jgi:hypothetical protein
LPHKIDERTIIGIAARAFTNRRRAVIKKERRAWKIAMTAQNAA